MTAIIPARIEYTVTTLQRVNSSYFHLASATVM
jgi:hypothetical protein